MTISINGNFLKQYDVVIRNLNKSRDKTDGVFRYKQFKCNNNNVSFQFR